ncbi:MAG: ribonuclease [Pseudomonadota bacterium]
MSRRVRRWGLSGAFALVVLGVLAWSLRAPDEAQADGFDFYVLALSWSPTWCELEGDPRARQCRDDADFGFVVHGLWPQFERDYPEFCDHPISYVPDSLVRDVIDLIPSAGLIGHQWRKHGTCSGLSPEAYFEMTRRAARIVSIPPALENIDSPVNADPNAIETAFRTANPGLPADGIAVTCDEGRLDEVRVCLTRELEFRRCVEVDRAACRADSVIIPPTD